nr:putative protein Fo15213 [Frankliniella occidentalis]
MKVSYRTDTKDPIVKKILASATSFAAECIRIEYEEGRKRLGLPENINFRNWKPSENKCPCPIYCERGLPCRHMFTLRLLKGVDVFSPADVPARWQKLTVEGFRERIDEPPASSYIPEGFIGTEVLKTGGKPLSQNQRYKQASELALEAAQLIALHGGKDYAKKMKILDQMTKIWRRGKDVVILEAVGDGEGGGLIVEISSDVASSENDKPPNVPDTSDGSVNDNLQKPSVVNHHASFETENHCSADDGTGDIDVHVNSDFGESIPTNAHLDTADPKNCNAQTNKAIKEVLGVSQNRKYYPLSKDMLNQMEVPKSLKIRGRPKGRVLTKIGIRKTSKEKVECHVCSEMGWWKESRMNVHGEIKLMLLCPSCLMVFESNIVPNEDGIIEEFDSEEDDNFENACSDAQNSPARAAPSEKQDPDIICISSDDEDQTAHQMHTAVSDVKMEVETDADLSDLSMAPQSPGLSESNSTGLGETESLNSLQPTNPSITTNSTGENDYDKELAELWTVIQSNERLNMPNTRKCDTYIPKCNCGNFCERRTSERPGGPNFGRDFFRCPIQCPKKIFRWVDTLYNVAGSSGTLPPKTPPKKNSSKSLRKTPTKTPSKSQSKTPSKSQYKTPTKSQPKTARKTVSKNPLKIICQNPSQTACMNDQNDVCFCGVPVVKRKVYFGDHVGKMVSICGKDPVVCTFKNYTEKPAATSGFIVPPLEHRQNVSVRRKIGS